uniref:Uncharacterized protein n=1 Tax=Rhizophora mucronata TaxID=61149 RepID=A0A2P2R285_RHIMU
MISLSLKCLLVSSLLLGSVLHFQLIFS